jgi:diguanylate cyclase (GGDEF)-like protein
VQRVARRSRDEAVAVQDRPTTEHADCRDIAVTGPSHPGRTIEAIVGLRRSLNLWRRASFTLKFAVVLAAAAGMIAVVPLLLANSEARSEALDRAADKAGIAHNLLEGQRNALSVFVRAVAQQVAGLGPESQSDDYLAQTLRQDAGVNPGGDLLAIVPVPSDVVALRGGKRLDSSAELVSQLTAAALSAQTTAAGPDGGPWILSRAEVPGSSAVVYVARPITDSLVSAIDHNLATSADPSELAVVRGSRQAVTGSIGGASLQLGADVDPALSAGLSTGQGAFVLPVGGRNLAVATSAVGGGFEMVVSTPVGVIVIAWPSLLALIALVLLAMIVIVLVVQTDLQRPLRRLDRAVAALGSGRFDVPVPTGSQNELGRLGATFEAMRRQLQAMIRATTTRAAVATELNSQQPLQTALARVCGELRRATEVDAVLILGSGSDMSDPFAVADGIPVDLDVDSFLRSDGPLGAGCHHTGGTALLVGAAPASLEAQLGMREFCVASLRVGQHLLGVLALANVSRGFIPSDADLLFGAAEQMAIALERYRMIAQVQRQASMDDLTGLHNHRFFVDYLGQQVAIAERLNTPLAVLMVDIDHFKALNDSHGHQAGDAALAAFADTLRACVRRSDLAARYGGEEFAVVMTNTGIRQARVVAEKIRRTVADTAVSVDISRPELKMTVSVGGAAYPEDTNDAGELLSLADAALYHSKRAGRNRVSMSIDHRKHRQLPELPDLPQKAPREVTVGAGGRDRSAK